MCYVTMGSEYLWISPAKVYVVYWPSPIPETHGEQAVMIVQALPRVPTEGGETLGISEPKLGVTKHT